LKKAFCIVISIMFALILCSKISIPDETSVGYINYLNANMTRYIDVPVIGISSDLKSAIVGRARVALSDNGCKLCFDSRTGVDERTAKAVSEGIYFAENITGQTASFFISYDMHTNLVSGGSSGAAISLAAIALLSNKTLNENAAITGEIDNEGNFHSVGSVPLKSLAAAKSGFMTMIIPKNSSTILVYEKHPADSFSQHEYYIQKSINLTEYMKDNYNMQLIEAGNLKDVIDIILKEN
jgi:hypothetical protein